MCCHCLRNNGSRVSHPRAFRWAQWYCCARNCLKGIADELGRILRTADAGLEELNHGYLVAVHVDGRLRITHVYTFDAVPTVAFGRRAIVGFGGDEAKHLGGLPGRQSEI